MRRRCISHELLNAATLGLKLISDDIRTYPDLFMMQHSRAAGLTESLDDVQLACSMLIVLFVKECIKIFSGPALE